MNRTSILLIAPLLGLFAAGCGEEKKDPPAAPSAAAAAAPKPTAKAAAGAVAVADDDVPSAADFEDEAEKDITAANLEAELATLEKEVDAE